MALAGGAFSMQSSDLAKARATSPALKQFAELESEEQRAVMQALQIAGIPVPSSVQLPAEKSEMLRRLQAVSGTEFDRMYLAGQITGHQELLQLHTAAAQNAQTPGERAISTVAVPAIRTHVAMLQALQAQMRG
jgi:putative membrane protein